MPGTGYRNLFEESVSNVTATPSVALGERRLEGGKEYVYAYNAATTAAVGYGMIQSLNSGFSCTVSAAAYDQCFGVVQNTDLEASQYGWLQVKGPANVIITADHASAETGRGIFLNTNGGFGAVTTGATGSTHYVQGQCGVALQTIGTDQTGKVYLNCYG